MKRVLIIASLLLSVGCIKDDIAVCPSEQDNTTIIIPVDANLGEAIIKFKPEMEDILDMTLTRSGGEATRSGIPSTDEVLDILGAYSFERVFPVDPRHEERTREAGLHLWYIVRFDESENIGEAFARLSKLGEVDKLQCNRQLKRAYNPNSTVHTVSATRSGETESTKWPFNDNLISRQWCYANDGTMVFNEDGRTRALAGCDAGCLEAWELCTGDEDIIVAVMDEAPMWSHPDLEANIWVNEGEELHAGKDADGNGYKDDKYGYNFVRNTGVTSWTSNGSTGHGTHVAGTIAAVNNNETGCAGIAGGDAANGVGGVKIMTLQLFDGMNSCSLAMEARAMKYAADNGAVVLQCSWGYNSAKANLIMGYTPGPATEEEWASLYPLEKEAIDYFIHKAGSPNGVINGGLAIFASGNEYAAQSSFPAAYSKCISVAAVAADYTPASYSNYGKEVLLCAPGGDLEYHGEVGKDDTQEYQGAILSTLVINGEACYGYYEGTSMACPHVSGVAALGLSYAKKLGRHFTSEEFKDLMYESARDIDEYFEGEKLYYMRHTSAGATPIKMNLEDYKGKMGRLVDAGSLLKAIEGSGRDMRLPNIYLAPNNSTTLTLSDYNIEAAKSAEVVNTAIAEAKLDGNTLTITAKSIGQTSLTVVADKSYSVTITVREGANDNC
ncbi:MAG: S8 family serine peptidase, partial [Alistipes sp.]|nr:S8 family serine peptidase [Alistipes sp.]